MRSAGCVINDYADRDFDGHVRRTRDRPLPQGQVTKREALFVFFVLLALCGALVTFTNRLTMLLSLMGALLAVIYPFMKRYTYLPQVFLGAAFGWGVPMAFAAQTNTVPKLAWALMSVTVLWALIYDTQYAMVDREDDLRLGIKSTAILFDDMDRTFIAVFQVLMLCGLILIGRDAGLGWPYWAALGGCLGLAIHQQRLIHTREPDQCFAAFMNNNWYGAVVFAGIGLSYWPVLAAR